MNPQRAEPQGMTPSGKPNPSYYNTAGAAVEIFQLIHKPEMHGDMKRLLDQVIAPLPMREAIGAFKAAAEQVVKHPKEKRMYEALREALKKVSQFAPQLQNICTVGAMMFMLKDANDSHDQEVAASAIDAMNAAAGELHNALSTFDSKARENMSDFFNYAAQMTQKPLLSEDEMKTFVDKGIRVLEDFGVKNAIAIFGK